MSAPFAVQGFVLDLDGLLDQLLNLRRQALRARRARACRRRWRASDFCSVRSWRMLPATAVDFHAGSALSMALQLAVELVRPTSMFFSSVRRASAPAAALLRALRQARPRRS